MKDFMRYPFNNDPKEIEVLESVVFFHENNTIKDACVVFYAYARCCDLIIGIGRTKQEAIDTCLDNWKKYFSE